MLRPCSDIMKNTANNEANIKHIFEVENEERNDTTRELNNSLSKDTPPGA